VRYRFNDNALTHDSGGLSIIAYGIAVSTDRLEVKDLLW
jgi:hypothetical protein